MASIIKVNMALMASVHIYILFCSRERTILPENDPNLRYLLFVNYLENVIARSKYTVVIYFLTDYHHNFYLSHQ